MAYLASTLSTCLAYSASTLSDVIFALIPYLVDPDQKYFRFLNSRPDELDEGKKTMSRYCPFNNVNVQLSLKLWL